jgi:hypothetical protein
MGYTIESFAAECHRLLKEDPGPKGREKVSEVLRQALQDEAFVDANFDESSPERRVVYEDPDLGFCILAHSYKGASESKPHDHGPSWAIYGQARGETAMTEWALVEAATPERPGKVRKVRTTVLKPGMAFVYNEGDLHSPSRSGPTKLIRFEGTNMDHVKRLAYEEA